MEKLLKKSGTYIRTVEEPESYEKEKSKWKSFSS